MRGRKPMPAALRAISGVRSHKARPEHAPPDPDHGVPDPPADLPADALAAWPYVARLVDLCCTVADVEALALLARARAYVTMTYAALERMPTDRQTQIAYEVAQRIYAARLSDFGLTPATRQRVAGKPQDGTSQWAEFARKA